MKLLLALSALLAVAWPAGGELVFGSYYGLFSDPNQVSPKSCGSITITLRPTGAFSGQAQADGTRASFSGRFDADGTATVNLKGKNMESAQVDLRLITPISGDSSIVGTLSSGSWSARLSAQPAGFDGKANIAPQAGRYTVLILTRPGSPTTPGGYGYGTVTVSKAGNVSFVGALADGTKISQAAALSKEGWWPFYVSLYGGQGSAMSWILFDDGAPTDLGGSLSWIKPSDAKAKYYPGGFTNETAIAGYAYHPPANSSRILPFEAGDVALGGGNLQKLIVNHVTLDSKNRVKNLSSNQLSMTFTLATGAFRGKVATPGTTKTFSFAGVAVQSAEIGIGYFLGASLTGFVEFRTSVGDVVKFQTLGSSFAPAVELSVTPEAFAWSWSDGTASSAYPVASKGFASAAARDQYLNVYPAGVLSGINLGFDGSDGATNAPIAQRPPQDVGAVSFARPLTGLRYWASSYNPITNTPDFTGFLSLEDIECFHCTNLQHVAVANLPSLKRLCFEACDLQELDLTGDPNLEDVRAAINGPNAYTEIKIGGGTGPKIWHLCVRDNPQLTQDLQTIMTNFYSLREPWFWDANQSGALKFVSTNLTDVEVYNNHYTSADFSGQANLQFLWTENNNLTNLVLDGCVSLLELRAQDNELTTKVLDNILTVLDSSCPNLQLVNLVNNAQPPSAIGCSAAASLTKKGVKVYVDCP